MIAVFNFILMFFFSAKIVCFQIAMLAAFAITRLAITSNFLSSFFFFIAERLTSATGVDLAR